MASSDANPVDHLPVERLTLADLPGCLALSLAAHWNQVEADWLMFFDQGVVWGIRVEGALAASAALLPYPPQTAWISMVLTMPAARGRGFARRLTSVALQDCERRNLVPQLDATPEGERVYRRLGFETLAQLTRWRRPAATEATGGTAGDTQEQIELINSLDETAIGFARRDLLSWLQRRGPASVNEAAYALSRDGRTARQIGPIVGDTWDRTEAALLALQDRLGSADSLIIDALDEAAALAAFLQDQGYEPERPFLRMAKGAPPRFDPMRYLASAGPELG